MVKVQGQTLNRNTVKQTAENNRKLSGDNNAAGITSLVPGIKNPRLWNGLEFDWPYYIGLLRQVAYKLIPVCHEDLELLTWPCMKARWHRWHHNRSHVPFFRRLFDGLSGRLSIPDLHHWIQRKKKTDQIRAYYFGMHFFLSWECSAVEMPIPIDKAYRGIESLQADFHPTR